MCLLGEVKLFGGFFVPERFLLADGLLLQIVDNIQLFSIYGTNFGGDGRTTFGIPDLTAITPPDMIYMVCADGTFPTR